METINMPTGFCWPQKVDIHHFQVYEMGEFVQNDKVKSNGMGGGRRLEVSSTILRNIYILGTPQNVDG